MNVYKYLSFTLLYILISNAGYTSDKYKQLEHAFSKNSCSFEIEKILESKYNNNWNCIRKLLLEKPKLYKKFSMIPLAPYSCHNMKIFINILSDYGKYCQSKRAKHKFYSSLQLMILSNIFMGASKEEMLFLKFFFNKPPLDVFIEKNIYIKIEKLKKHFSFFNELERLIYTKQYKKWKAYYYQLNLAKVNIYPIYNEDNGSCDGMIHCKPNDCIAIYKNKEIVGFRRLSNKEKSIAVKQSTRNKLSDDKNIEYNKNEDYNLFSLKKELNNRILGREIKNINFIKLFKFIESPKPHIIDVNADYMCSLMPIFNPYDMLAIVDENSRIKYLFIIKDLPYSLEYLSFQYGVNNEILDWTASKVRLGTKHVVAEYLHKLFPEEDMIKKILKRINNEKNGEKQNRDGAVRF
jgi:hypothetical protein